MTDREPFSILTDITHVKVWRYALPYRMALQGGHTERRGLILEMETSAGKGLGEIAPLPGFSRENLDEVERELKTWLEQVRIYRRLPRKDKARTTVMQPPIPTLPSIGFGASAALDALQHPLEDRFPVPVQVNALIGGPVERWQRQAKRRINEGFQVLKIKVGRHDYRQEAAALVKLHQKLGRGIQLRLDANRTWDLDTAIEFSKLISGTPIAYIEEPLADPGRLSDFNTATRMPLALDESMRDEAYTTGDAPLPAGTRAVILKPMLEGTWDQLRKKLVWIREKGLVAVITSTLETEIGLHALATLVARHLPDVACGLGTLRVFERGLLSRSEFGSGPEWFPTPLWSVTALDKRRLEKIYAW